MPEIGNRVIRAGKGLLSISIASVIRTSLGGWKQGQQSLADTYRAVSPFSPLRVGAGQKMFDRIPARSLASLGGILDRVTLDLRFVSVDGSTPYQDLIAILALAKKQNPSAALEFGTYFGSATANLALNLPEATINTIDLPEDMPEATALIEGKPVDDLHLIRGRQLGKAFRGTPLESRIVQHTGDTATYDYSVIPGPVSLFLIDGSHTYEYARNDTMRSFAVAEGDCTFLWHDCEPYTPGVLRCLVELIDAGLPVVRVEGTAVACLEVNAQDSRVQHLIQA
jgi:Methyltransferase domain